MSGIISHTQELVNHTSLFPAEVVTVVATEEMWEKPLIMAEEELIVTACTKRKREFRAGRNCAHAALDILGLPRQPILRDSNRAPCWPEGYQGSISHCKDLCLAACTSKNPIMSLGLDVEPLAPLSPEVEGYIYTSNELEYFHSLSRKLPERLVFSAKESLYKCLYPLINQFFGFHAVEIVLDDRKQLFNFHSTGQIEFNIPDHLQFHGRYLVTKTHLITGCYLSSIST